MIRNYDLTLKLFLFICKEMLLTACVKSTGTAIAICQFLDNITTTSFFTITKKISMTFARIFLRTVKNS